MSKRLKGPQFSNLLRRLMARGHHSEAGPSSIADVAAASNHSQKTVKRWLARETCPPGGATIARLAEHFGVPPAALQGAADAARLFALAPESARYRESAHDNFRDTASLAQHARHLSFVEARVIDWMRELSASWSAELTEEVGEPVEVDFAFALYKALQIRKVGAVEPPRRLWDYLAGGTPPPLFEGVAGTPTAARS